MRPWLNWIEQQISNLWVAGSSPAGRATKLKPGLSRFYFCIVQKWTRTEKSCEATTGSTTSRFDKRSAVKSLRLTRRQDAERVLLGAPRFFHFLLIFKRFYGTIFLDLRRIIAPFLLLVLAFCGLFYLTKEL